MTETDTPTIVAEPAPKPKRKRATKRQPKQRTTKRQLTQLERVLAQPGQYLICTNLSMGQHSCSAPEATDTTQKFKELELPPLVPVSVPQYHWTNPDFIRMCSMFESIIKIEKSDTLPPTQTKPSVPSEYEEYSPKYRALAMKLASEPIEEIRRVVENPFAMTARNQDVQFLPPPPMSIEDEAAMEAGMLRLFRLARIFEMRLQARREALDIYDKKLDEAIQRERDRKSGRDLRRWFVSEEAKR